MPTSAAADHFSPRGAVAQKKNRLPTCTVLTLAPQKRAQLSPCCLPHVWSSTARLHGPRSHGARERARFPWRARGCALVASRGCSGLRDGLSPSMPLTRIAPHGSGPAARSLQPGHGDLATVGVTLTLTLDRARGGEHPTVATAATPTERLRLRPAMLENFLPRFARSCSARSRARGFALRDR